MSSFKPLTKQRMITIAEDYIDTYSDYLTVSTKVAKKYLFDNINDIFEDIYNTDVYYEISKLHPYQQRIIFDAYYSHLLDKNGYLVEIPIIGTITSVFSSAANLLTAAGKFAMGTVDGLLSAAKVLASNPFTLLLLIASLIALRKGTWKWLSSVCEVLGNTLNMISKFPHKQKLKYEVIMKNTVECYKRCGISPNEISGYHIILAFTKGELVPAKIYAAVKCLRECYMIMMCTKFIPQVFKDYIVCLKHSKQLDLLAKMDINIPMSKTIALPATGSCSNIAKMFNELLEKFNMLLDYIFSSEENREYFREMLRNSLNNVYKATVSNINNKVNRRRY